MSDRIDKDPDDLNDKNHLEDDDMPTRAIDTDARDEQEEERWTDSEPEDDGWDDADEDELPPRPRGRLLRPLPLALIAVVIAAAGFLGGVEAQKGSESSGGAAGFSAAGGLPSFAKAGAEEAGGESGEEAGGEAARGSRPSAVPPKPLLRGPSPASKATRST